MKFKLSKVLPFAFILFIGLHLFGQEIEVHLGKPQKSSRRAGIHGILGKTDKGLLLLNASYSLFKSTSFTMEYYNESMNLKSSSEIELPNKDLSLESFLLVENDLYVFMSKYDKDKNINSLYGTIISEDGSFDNDIIEIAQVSVEKKRKMNEFHITQSEDSTKFLVSIVPEYNKDVKEQINYLVLDHDFKELDNMMIKFPFDDSDFTIYDFQLDKYGNVHLLGLVTIEEDRRKTLFKGSVEREARLFSFYKGSDEVKEYKLGILEEKAGYLSQIVMKTDDLGRLQCSGFYSDTKGRSMRGIFVFTLNIENQEIENISSQEFTDAFIDEFLSDRQKRKKERKKRKDKENPYDKLRNYKIRDLVMKDGGGFYLVAEYYLYRVTTTTDANGNTRTTSHYYYNDLVVVNVDKDNTVSWFSRVPKRQHTTNDGGINSGITTGLNSDNSLNIIFNDHRDNATQMSPENLKNIHRRKSKTVLVKFDPDGNASKTPLMSTKDTKTTVRPKYSRQIGPNDIILYGVQRGKKTRLINVILK